MTQALRDPAGRAAAGPFGTDASGTPSEGGAELFGCHLCGSVSLEHRPEQDKHVQLRDAPERSTPFRSAHISIYTVLQGGASEDASGRHAALETHDDAITALQGQD